MIYGSICSGIEAATVAWHPLGWKPAFFSEIEKFPRAVLQHHYPDVPLHGDFTTIGADDYGPIDLLVGGTPCQSFSIAGLGGGLDDDRGNLALEYLLLARRKRPEWMVWENVPGVFSSTGGEDFRAFLSGAAGWDIPIPAGGWKNSGVITNAPGCYGLAWRVLDAQYIRVQSHSRAVPQRRRRVFVIGYLGDWRRAAAVLFERQSLSGDPAPSRKAGESVAGYPAIGIDEEGNASIEHFAPLLRGGQGGTRQSVAVFGGGQTIGPRDVAATLTAHANRQDFDVENFVAITQWGDVAGTLSARHDYSPCADRGQNIVAFTAINNGRDATDNITPTLGCGGGCGQGAGMAVAFAQNTRDEVRLINGDGQIAGVLAAEPGTKQQTYTAKNMAVRRLTPLECSRLQGFPDNHCRIPWRGKSAELCPDGPQYKAYGNSMAIPPMRLIGERINQVNAIPADEKEMRRT